MSLISLFVCGQLAALSLVVFFTNRSFFYRPQAMTKTVFYIFGVICVMLFGGSVFTPLFILSHARPIVYDPVIYHIEAVSGISPAPVIKGLAVLARETSWVNSSVYDDLPLMVVLAASSQLVYSPWHFRDNLFIQFAMGAFIGYALYYLLPAVSPGIYFQAEFPAHMPGPSLVPKHSVFFDDGGLNPRNAMPSMHAAWAIMSFLALRHSPLWHRALGLLYVAVTFVTTIGFGYHYILDWVVALPLVLLICGVTNARPMAGLRCFAVVTGSVLLAAWCAVIRMAPMSLAHPIFIQALITASLVLPAYTQLRLMRAGVPLPIEQAKIVRVGV